MPEAQTRCYEEYPKWIILLSNSVSMAIYLVGGFLVLQLGFIFLLAYLLFIVLLEMRLLSKSCANCYYYGRLCAFGKGKICAMVFKKGDSNNRIHERVTWKASFPIFSSS